MSLLAEGTSVFHRHPCCVDKILTSSPFQPPIGSLVEDWKKHWKHENIHLKLDSTVTTLSYYSSVPKLSTPMLWSCFIISSNNDPLPTRAFRAWSSFWSLSFKPKKKHRQHCNVSNKSILCCIVSCCIVIMLTINFQVLTKLQCSLVNTSWVHLQVFDRSSNWAFHIAHPSMTLFSSRHSI